MTNTQSHKSEVLIVGAGVLGTSTALSLSRHQKYTNSHITILDAAPQLPNSSGASIDTSRILRADYAVEAYTRLVSEARSLWLDCSDDGWGGQGRYHDARLLLTELPGVEGHVDGYLEESLTNLRRLAASGKSGFHDEALTELYNREAIRRQAPFPGVSGNTGYVNDNCGWVNAEACVRYAYKQIQKVGENRITIKSNARVRGLLTEKYASTGTATTRCCGVELDDGSLVRADLVVLAAGAWTSSLIDLGGRAVATGQVLSYLTLSDEEQETLKSSPMYFNVSRGMFMVPPHHNELKLGRHGFGYQNPKQVQFSKLELATDGSSSQRTESQAVVSIPRTDLPIPAEAEAACRDFLVDLNPQWKDRNFTKTRLCWYCDTPTGDFLIDYHPQYADLFIATGDSGHVFKLFPVIGDKVVDAIEGCLNEEYRSLWRWRDDPPDKFVGVNDGTRGGRHGMILEQETCRGMPRAQL
ncbi:hypothetical protein LTR05_008317 [Lithohypha guttulata]|uniref:FAD dependent oxidoreductase domain-containing protein n=1 Tax=Lithohypha guttulata TaxID=1690604 RepID=A0AAN7YCV9_9EURO|nr:hypothetical protein LTR05_008317 [Lithohypha guttulata]